MSETSPLPAHDLSLPPPAPPLPPARLGPLQRFIAPFSRASGRNDVPASKAIRRPPQNVPRRTYGVLPSQTAAHRTGIPIAAIDVNQQKTHAILAGKEILKTVRVHDSKVTEEFNLRSSIVSYASTHGSPQGDSASRRREYLPARDVKWSVGKFDHIIATAAANGRISIYDVNAAGSRIELAWLHEHQGQVNKLDFDPFGGYWLLSASQDKTVKLWDIREPKATRAKQRFDVRSPVREVRWSPKEGNDFDFAVCADGGIIQNWDARNPLGPKLSINAHERGCHSLDWHPDGRHVVSGGFDKYVRVWDFKSDNRRAKPTYQFRAPQAIRIVRWRPSNSIFDSPETGVFKQTAQIATTYHYDDPRIHLWDFRRPLLPFRELDSYNSPATDFLWASQDLLWTVGDQGWFTQNDVNHAPQIQNSLPPSALDWMPDGSCAMFMEERDHRRSSDPTDPLAGFLNIHEDRLSGEDGGHVAQFDVDADDGVNESLLTASLRRRQSRGLSSKSVSQANSPPVADNFIQQLDRTMLASKDLLQNNQTGVVGLVEGASADPGVVEFLSDYYSAPATESERKASPNLILQRLESCFNDNADMCDEVSLHRLAQSWRMLSTVIVLELRDWADSNRSTRRAEAAKKREKGRSSKDEGSSVKSSPFAKSSSLDFQTKGEGKETTLMSSLFRSVRDQEKGSRDRSTSSNMTTPLARPVTDSPRRSLYHKSKASDDSKADLEDLQALPPSLLNSHSTASAAARALLDNASATSGTPPTSPGKQRLSPKKSKAQQMGGNESVNPASPSPRTAEVPLKDPTTQSQRAQLQREEQRAALRDYRAQARPIFTLDTPVKSPNYGAPEVRDSAESFPMFPASTSSSHKERSIGDSITSHDRPSTSSVKDGRWLSREMSGDSEVSLGMESLNETMSPKQKPTEKTDRPFYGSNDFSGGLDGSVDANEAVDTSRDYLQQTESDKQTPSRSNPSQSAISSSPELFHFDPSCSPPKQRIHMTNPVSRAAPTANHKQISANVQITEDTVTAEDMASEDYIFSDFKPIDRSRYQPRLPFAWSSLPLVCQMIAFDMDNGIAGAQFAVHLLLHVAPYFFSMDFQDSKVPSKTWSESVAERLMVPSLSHRIIEALLLKHTAFLRKMHLFAPLAEIRKLSAELGYDRVVKTGSDDPKDMKDPYVVASACSNCQSPMPIGKNVCSRCYKSRAPCPICLSTELQPETSTTDDDGSSKTRHQPQLWSFCQACGHSGHSTCMQEWLSSDFAEGACPTPGCGCDCGPGSTRDARIQQQVQKQEEAKLIRGSGSGASKKDHLRATHSPAVDKTRAVLRAAASDDRGGTQSSDERSSVTRRSSNRGRSSVASGVGSGGLAAASASSKKSVRLVTPGEERRGSGNGVTRR